jgi:hypothetical protein
LKGLYPTGRLSDDYPLQGQLVDQLSRGACGQHRCHLPGASTYVRHRRHLVGCGLIGGELGIRVVEGYQVRAVSAFGRGLGRQSVVGIALGGGDGLTSLQRLTGHFMEPGQRVGRRVRLDVARYHNG